MKKLICLALVLALCLAAMPVWAEAAPVEAVRQAIHQALAQQADTSSDPWVKFLLSQTVDDLRAEGGNAFFSVSAWDPGVEKLSGDEEDWLLAIWQSILLNGVEGRVRYEERDGEVVLTGGMSDFISDVKAAASYAEGQFDLTQVRRAIVARLLPTRLYDQAGQPTQAFAALIRLYQGVLTQAQLEAALSMQKSASLGVSGGPEALRLVFYCGSGKRLAQEALEQAQKTLASTDLANALSEEEIALVYAHAFAQQAEVFRTGSDKGEKQAITLDFQQMMTQSLYQQDFVDYAQAVTEEFMAQLPGLVELARSMPDYPLRDQPASGVLFSTASEEEGTLLILRAADDGLGRYLVLLDEGGQVALTAFLRPGERCRAYATAGQYTLLCAKGRDWYGTVRMFMEAGEYVAAQEMITVLDDTHYHTVTLGGEDALPVRGAQAEEFAGRAQAEDAGEAAQADDGEAAQADDGEAAPQDA